MTIYKKIHVLITLITRIIKVSLRRSLLDPGRGVPLDQLLDQFSNGRVLLDEYSRNGAGEEIFNLGAWLTNHGFELLANRLLADWLIGIIGLDILLLTVYHFNFQKFKLLYS